MTIMFTAAKDAMAGKAAQVYLNTLISRYGKITELKLDSQRKTLTATCHLLGETEPITVTVGKYVIDSTGPKKFIHATDCTCNRPWAQSLLKDFVEGRRVELPGAAASML
jgi:hypothetical protein